MNYYAVKKGRTPGIYMTWDDCKKQVMGYSGAIYKKFSNLEEANLFVNGEIVKGEKKSNKNILNKEDSLDKEVEKCLGNYFIV